jgi:hypothetical protein
LRDITLFTVEEASRLIEEIRPKLEELRKLKGEFDQLGTQILALRMATEGAAEGNPDALELAESSRRRRRIGRDIARGLSDLSEAGAHVKDLDTGLCDFYALMGDRLVFLCWKLDEPELAHWHGLAEGFAGRRPLKNAERD